MPGVFVGVDLGTSALKCGAWDRAGRRRALSVSGRLEGELGRQDAEGWIVALEGALADLVAELDGEPIAALAIGGHAPSPVFCDAQLRALAPAPTWQDERAREDFEGLTRREPTLRGPGDARLEARVAAHVAHFMREQPTLAARLHTTLLSWEFLIARCSGEAVTTTSATVDIVRLTAIPGTWRPAQRRGPGQLVGTSTPALASRTGLPVGTPVFVGGIDSRLASVGSGIAELGQACINCGSSAIVAQLARPGDDARFELGGLGLVSEPVRLGGGLLDRLLGERTLAQRDAIIGEAMGLDPGCVIVPLASLWSSSRAEILGTLEVIASARGLALATRAAIERMLLAQRRVLDSFGRRLGRARSVRVVGGLAADARLHQLICDALDHPIDIPAEHHASALGAAMVAAVGGGEFVSLGHAAAAMCSVRRRLTPGPDRDRLRLAYEQMLASHIDIHLQTY